MEEYFVTKYDIEREPAALRAVLEDTIMHKGYPATAGSGILESFVAPFSATVVQRLEDAGIAIVGKARMREFGAAGLFAADAVDAADATDTADAAESGAVAAVADGAAEVALCNDYTGVIRRQAAAHGLYYIHPTYGTVSRYGLIQAAPSMDQIGIVCKKLVDGFYVLSVIAGYDPSDGIMSPGSGAGSGAEAGGGVGIVVAAGSAGKDIAASSGAAAGAGFDVEKPSADTTGATKLKIGIPLNVWKKEAFQASPEQTGSGDQPSPTQSDEGGISDEGRKAARAIINDFDEKFEIVEFELEHFDIFTQVMQILCSAEISANIARFDGIKYGYRASGYNGLHELYTKSRTEAFGADAKLIAILGAAVLSQENYERYYEKAMRIRRMIMDSLDFGKYDIIAMPASNGIGDDVIAAGVLAQLCGLPSVTLPGNGHDAYMGNASGTTSTAGGASPTGTMHIGITLVANAGRMDLIYSALKAVKA